MFHDVVGCSGHCGKVVDGGACTSWVCSDCMILMELPTDDDWDRIETLTNGSMGIVNPYLGKCNLGSKCFKASEYRCRCESREEFKRRIGR